MIPPKPTRNLSPLKCDPPPGVAGWRKTLTMCRKVVTAPAAFIRQRRRISSEELAMRFFVVLVLICAAWQLGRRKKAAKRLAVKVEPKK